MGPISEELFSYRLCGDLILEDPSAFLDGPRLSRLAELQPHFLQLGKRPRTDTTNFVPLDYRARFTAFLDKEPSLWNPPRSATELVRPSGEPDSPIAHHLHNPSFNTNHLNGIETADETNACIWLVMKNGFEPGKMLIFDHLARHEKSEEVDGIDAYAPEILKCHEEFVESVRTHILATVEVVWGVKVRRRMKATHLSTGNPLEPFQLWGKYKEVTLFLEWDVDSTVVHQSQRLKRIIVLVMHPQVFLHPWGKKHARLQDLKLVVAGKIARVEMIEDFYQKKPWTSKNDFIRLVCQKEAKLLERKALDAMKKATSFQKTEKIKELSNSEQHQPTIFSTTRLIEILEAGLSTTYGMDVVADADESDNFMYLPKGLQEWIASQHYIMFEGQSISTSKELASFYKRHCVFSDNELPVPEISPTDMVLELMKMQLKMLNALTIGKSSIIDQWSFYGFGKFSVVKVKCNSCNQILANDEKARWSIIDRSFYITRKTTQHACHPKSRFQAIPQDRSTKFIQANQGQLKKPRWQGQEVEWENLLRTQE